MLFKVFSFYDAKAEAYMSPFMMHKRGEAIRAFSDAANDPKSFISSHPEDYFLYEIATFDNATGVYVSLDNKVSVGCALDFVSSRGTNEDSKGS